MRDSISQKYSSLGVKNKRWKRNCGAIEPGRAVGTVYSGLWTSTVSSF
jgi:hypothetical protein